MVPVRLEVLGLLVAPALPVVLEDPVDLDHQKYQKYQKSLKVPGSLVVLEDPVDPVRLEDLGLLVDLVDPEALARWKE